MSSNAVLRAVCKMLGNRMRKRHVLYTFTAIFLLFMFFVLVHNSSIKSKRENITKSALLKEDIGENEKNREDNGVYKVLEEKDVKLEKTVEKLAYVDPIRKPAQNRMPVVRADKKINAMVDAHHLPAKVKKLTIDELEPPDHLEAVKMEQDGHLNREYKKEIFLGNHEEFDEGNKEDMSDKLQEIFQKVDQNEDKRIDLEELENWILQKVEEHFEEAGEENEEIFKALDKDNDGFLNWKEFHVEFLVAMGNNEEDANKHVEDYDTLMLEPQDKERLARYKLAWAEADAAPAPDGRLTPAEFHEFRHPELSPAALARMVQDVIDNLDHDVDGRISEAEFVALPAPGGGDGGAAGASWQDERRREFHDTMDTDHDGIVTRDELTRYVDPRNPQHARLEARNLLELGDANHDGRLSLTEVLDNMHLFLGSKMVAPGRSFHDEM